MKLSRRALMKSGFATGILSAAGLNAELLAAPVAHKTPSSTGRERFNLDTGWRFHFGHAANPDADFGFDFLEIFSKTGIEKGPTGHTTEVFTAAFDDSAWIPVTFPHDWAVGLPFVESTDHGVISHGLKPLGRRFPDTSIGWYRKSFDLPASAASRSLELEFEAIARDSIVVLNGFLLGRHESGYIPARYDLTSAANFGGSNTLVVRADATFGRGWFYEGAGIHRHAWLTLTDPLRVVTDGTLVTTKSLAPEAATLHLRCEVEYSGMPVGSPAERTCRVRTEIFDPTGRRAGVIDSSAVSIPAGGMHEFRDILTVPQPQAWSPAAPALYRAVHTVLEDGTPVDSYETTFGIRTARFDADRGFLLNGQPLKLQGFSMHPDHAGVGMAVPDAVQQFRLERLQWMGANAYRTAHNPHSPALMDACDRLGVLVMDETRSFSLSPFAITDLEALVRRDRNHPSVVLWSLGNEEMTVQGDDHGQRITIGAQQVVARLDPSRQCTVAMNADWGKGITEVVEVQGVNYASDPVLEKLHRDFPRLPIVGTETASMVATRGEYTTDTARLVVSAYDVNKRPWSQSAAEWIASYGNRPWVAGGFAWTGFDYRGEPSPYPKYPSINSHFGVLDTCGFAKDMAWFYRAWWTNEPVLHLMPHWTWPGREGQPIEVWVLSNMDNVELFLNGHSLSAQPVIRQKHNLWTVPYAPGTLEVRGTRAGKLHFDRAETTGPATHLHLEPWKPVHSLLNQESTVVNISILDTQFRPVPDADALVSFRIEGPARIAGVGNGNPTSLEPDTASARRTFHGLCQAILIATGSGDVTLHAESTGLTRASVTINLSIGPAKIL